MDFWSRLLSPLSSGSSRKDQAKDPAKRLHRFEKEYGNLLVSWRNSSNLSRDGDAAEALEIRLQELTNILSDESRRPLPHPCIQYASLKQVYVPIGKIATTSYNEWIIKEAVLFFATLIESEEEAFVENPTFSASLTNLLVRITGVNSVRLGLDTESRVVELAFNITTKIRLDPEILPAWFKTQQQQQQQPGRGQDAREQDTHDKFAGRTQRGDFPLFYILMDYIHHEGKVGDFARTGLLYIIEAASSSAALEQWIVESDLSTLMATGLGALYSQLSRKLVIDHPTHDLPPILALSDYQHPTSSYEVVSSCAVEFQSHLETFLSHLLFWQDVLNHCKSVEVKSTLLEHFQVIFLQQLLYPSLLESSDIDGGSSVAVLTYLRRILESLDHPDMINLILHYLLALPDALPHAAGSRSSVSLARKRKSMDLATMMAEKSDAAATPLLFNLVDLILACLRSRNQQTIYVTLQLVSAILKRHHRYAVITLLKTDLLPPNNLRRTIGAQEQEIEYIMSLAGSIGGQGYFDDAYQSVLKDTMTRLESHSCSLKLVAPRVSTTNQRLPDSLPGAPRDVTEHTLRPEDPLLNSLLDLMETFFINPVETNLSVTETLVDLGICGYMRIEGWLARNPKSYTYDDEDEEAELEAETEPNPETEVTADTKPSVDPGAEVEAGAEADQETKPGVTAETRPDTEVLAGSQPETQPEFQEQPTAEERTEEPAEGLLETEQANPEPLGLEQRVLGEPEHEQPEEVSPKFVLPESETEVLHADELERMKAIKKCREWPDWTQSTVPRVLALFKRLEEQVTTYKKTIPRFEELVQQRREAFQTADTMLHTPQPTPKLGSIQHDTPDRRSFEEISRSGSPSRPSGLEGLAHRLLSELGTPSRSNSPRGRKEQNRSSGSGNATPAKPLAGPFPELSHSRERTGLGRSYSPTKPRDEPVPHRGPEDAIASQLAAFAAIDQTILARKVGLPEQKVEPIPLEFNKQPLQEPVEEAPEEAEVAAEENGPESPDIADLGPPEGNTVSVSHVITNVIVLQSFLFEVASLIQVRAGLFDEVRFV